MSVLWDYIHVIEIELSSIQWVQVENVRKTGRWNSPLFLQHQMPMFPSVVHYLMPLPLLLIQPGTSLRHLNDPGLSSAELLVRRDSLFLGSRLSSTHTDEPLA